MNVVDGAAERQQYWILDLKTIVKQGNANGRVPPRIVGMDDRIHDRFPDSNCRVAPDVGPFTDPMTAAQVMCFWRKTITSLAAPGSTLPKEVEAFDHIEGVRVVESIVEKFTEMEQDLARERKTMTRLWAKREEQIRGVIESTAGIYGDLQGIAGNGLYEIEGFQMTMLPAGGEGKSSS